MAINRTRRRYKKINKMPCSMGSDRITITAPRWHASTVSTCSAIRRNAGREIGSRSVTGAGRRPVRRYPPFGAGGAAARGAFHSGSPERVMSGCQACAAPRRALPERGAVVPGWVCLGLAQRMGPCLRRGWLGIRAVVT